MPNFVPNFVRCSHVSLAHPLFEAALLPGEAMPAGAGHPWIVTNAGPPPTFENLLSLLRTYELGRF
ncbi:hypothetical protein Hte_001283 [Hypoxylon texense]